MPPENIFFLALVIVAFGAFALALAYGSAVASGSKIAPQGPQKSTKAERA